MLLTGTITIKGKDYCKSIDVPDNETPINIDKFMEHMKRIGLSLMGTALKLNEITEK